MTIHFGIIDELPSALEEARTENARREARRKELESLTGCPINQVIDGRCSEPGCPNAGINTRVPEGLLLVEETCLQRQEQDEKGSEPGAGIFQTEARIRCVL